MARLTHEHVHDREVTVAPAAMAVQNIVRIVLTVAGAVGVIIGAFMQWVGGQEGVTVAFRAYYRPTFTDSAFLTSAGAVMILLGLIALLGLAMWGGWLSRVAGALGIIGFVLLLISIERAAGFELPEAIGLGLWVSFAGSVLVLISGFFSAPMVTREVTS